MVHILLFDTYPRLGRRTEVDDHVPSIEIGEYLDHKKIFCGGSDSQSSHLLASQPIRLSRMAPFDLSSRLMNHILTNVRFFHAWYQPTTPISESIVLVSLSVKSESIAGWLSTESNRFWGQLTFPFRQNSPNSEVFVEDVSSKCVCERRVVPWHSPKPVVAHLWRRCHTHLGAISPPWS